MLEATARRAERKQTQTRDEMETEVWEELSGSTAHHGERLADVDDDDDDGDDDGEGPVYNPKNLPLGWDGKPIPYWLYKLHGLDQKYGCEICGNFTYYGRRAFDRHFSEWRHAHSMRCLGAAGARRRARSLRRETPTRRGRR